MKWALPKAIILILLMTLSSCYRFPTDDDCSVIPITNNRDITCEKGKSPIPQANI